MRNLSALFTALAGLLFCILAALGLTDAVCPTEGCNLFRGLAVLGVDLYWVGAFFFGVAAALIVWHRGRQNRLTGNLLGLWLTAGLLVNIPLLALQALTAPCLSCLIVAGLLGLTVLLLLPSCLRMTARTLLVWFIVLVAALSGLLRQQLGPVPIHGLPEATVKIFFSPSCPSCLKELRELAQRPELHPRLALYPLALNAADLPVLLRFRQQLEAGRPLAAAVADLTEPATEVFPELELQKLRLLSFRNRAFLARIGAPTIPYLLTSTPARLTAPPPALYDQRPAAATELGNDEGCEYNQVQAECEADQPPPFLNLDLLRPH